jgi:hypothetical protein
MKTVFILIWEANLVLCRMTKNGSFSIQEKLATFNILFEFFRTFMVELFVMKRTVKSFALFRKKPYPSRPCIKYNFHFLRWTSKPKRSFIPHIFYISHLYIYKLFKLLMQIYCIIITNWRIKSLWEQNLVLLR